MRIICAGCNRELPPRQSTSGVDVLYVPEEECKRCRRKKGVQFGVTKIIRVGGYDPESKKKAVDPTLEAKS